MDRVLDILGAFFSLDWGYILAFALQFPFWLVAFGFAAAIFFENKNWFWSFVFLVFLVWSFGFFLEISGWVFPPYLMALDLVLATVITVVEPSSKTIQGQIGPLSTLRFLVPMAVLNVFILAL